MAPSTGEYQPVNDVFKIIFLLITIVDRVDDNTNKILRYSFQFVNLHTINSRVNAILILLVYASND